MEPKKKRFFKVFHFNSNNELQDKDKLFKKPTIILDQQKYLEEQEKINQIKKQLEEQRLQKEREQKEKEEREKKDLEKENLESINYENTKPENHNEKRELNVVIDNNNTGEISLKENTNKINTNVNADETQIIVKKRTCC